IPGPHFLSLAVGVLGVVLNQRHTELTQRDVRPSACSIGEKSPSARRWSHLRHPRRAVIVGTNTQAALRHVVYDLAASMRGPRAERDAHAVRTTGKESVQP